jgi:phosphodiesterase/alkaline phosphatase D-like protein
MSLWRGEGDERRLVREGVATTAEGYAKIEVADLAPGTWYHYAWFARDGDALVARGDAGRFRTALAPGCAETLVVAATACTHRRYAPFTSLVRMADQSPDLFLQLGDMSYNDGARDQEGFRSRWHEALGDPGYRAILPQCGMYHTWDDHEIVDSGDYYGIAAERRRAGIEAWFETLAVPRLGGDRFWDSYTWGDTAEFFVLDSRGERQPETRRSDAAVYLSVAQMAWLKAGLKASTARFKVLLNSVPMTDWPEAVIMESDRWEGYQAQRQELLDFIAAEGVEGVVIVAGDFHCGGVSRLQATGPNSRIFEILVGPGANGGNPMAFLWQAGSEAERERMFPADQFAYLSPDMAMTMLTFDPVEGSIQVVFTQPETEEVVYQAKLFLDGRIVPV